MKKVKKKECAVCQVEIKGRPDQVYCSNKCKSAAQYERRLSTDQFFFTVDKQLKTNRRLLKKYNQSGYTTMRKDVLLKDGFNPKFFTHYWKNPQGQVYLFCYEYGFLEITKDEKMKYLLVEWQDYMNK